LGLFTGMLNGSSHYFVRAPGMRYREKRKIGPSPVSLRQERQRKSVKLPLAVDGSK
jgi:hypothetical protein